MKVDSLYICPWSLKDPLCVSQSLGYIRGLAKEGYKFALITFESGRFPMSNDEIAAAKKDLAKGNISWHPIAWNQGTGVVSKLFSIAGSLFTGIRVCLRHRPELIHSRSSLPAFQAVSISKLFRTRFLYDADSVLSEEYADTGYMSRGSFGFRFLAWSERWARRNADRMIVLTEALKEEFLKNGQTTQIDVIPCCIDTEIFKADQNARERRRSELGISDEKLAIYVGKAGSWYLVEETFDLFRKLSELCPGAKLLIVSPDPKSTFDEIAEKHGVSNDSFVHRHAESLEVPEWLSAADVGFSLIRQLPSKRGSSPVKFAEYLSCGLPVVITSGIGDSSEITRVNNVGIVIDDTREETLNKAAVELNELVQSSSQQISERCRETAEGEFDLTRVGHRRFSKIYAELVERDAEKA